MAEAGEQVSKQSEARQEVELTTGEKSAQEKSSARLEGKVAIITGTGTRVGEAIAA
jgi:hypothetical protein